MGDMYIYMISYNITIVSNKRRKREKYNQGEERSRICP